MDLNEFDLTLLDELRLENFKGPNVEKYFNWLVIGQLFKHPWDRRPT